MKNDWILQLLKDEMNADEELIRTNKWLLEMDNKRMIYADVYGDFLHTEEKSERKSVLDVGGGVNALTKRLAENSEYYLCDFLAHGGSGYLSKINEEEQIHWIDQDWYEAELAEYDVIIANDIFPDVDQRLELFIDRMIPKCHELRLVLTYYNEHRFYQMGRKDDSEVMTFLSWDGEILGMKLKKYLSRIDADEEELIKMKDNHESIYWNGRQVCYAVVKGEL